MSDQKSLPRSYNCCKLCTHKIYHILSDTTVIWCESDDHRTYDTSVCNKFRSIPIPLYLINKETESIEAIHFLRKNNHTIPDGTLNFMMDSVRERIISMIGQ